MFACAKVIVFWGESSVFLQFCSLTNIKIGLLRILKLDFQLFWLKIVGLFFAQFLSVFPLFPFLPSFLFLISFFCCCFSKSTQIFIKKNLLFPVFVCPFFFHFVSLTFFLSFLYYLSCIPSLLSLRFFLLSFFSLPSFLLSLFLFLLSPPSHGIERESKKEEEEEQRRRERRK